MTQLTSQNLDNKAVLEQKQLMLQRLVALDAYRGFVMLMMCASHGFGFALLATQPGLAGWIASLFTHAPWEGLHFLDLIQPAFMFVVGVAMPIALTRRQLQGFAFGQLLQQVVWRAFVLIILSQIIVSIATHQLQFQLINVLSQIALTYFFCFLIMQTKFRWQVIIAILILVAHWGLFVLFPGSNGPYSQTDNIGAVIDRWVLGKNYPGYYVTINFMSSTVSTLLGVWTGRLLMKNSSDADKITKLLIAAGACFIVAWLLVPFNPVIKRLWTESFTFLSAGWVLVMFLIFYVWVEVLHFFRAAFPLSVVGMNSIFIYAVTMMMYPWLDEALAVFTNRFSLLGDLGLIVQACLVLTILWGLCYWLYKQKIFLTI